MNDLDVVEIYKTPRRIPIRRGDGNWYWRYKAAGNHKILATGAESYGNLSDLVASLERVLNLPKDAISTSRASRVRRDSDWAEVLVLVIP